MGGCGAYHGEMIHEDHELPPEVERYLALCERAFECMVREGKWPWADSPDFSDVIESNDNPHDP